MIVPKGELMRRKEILLKRSECQPVAVCLPTIFGNLLKADPVSTDWHLIVRRSLNLSSLYLILESREFSPEAPWPGRFATSIALSGVSQATCDGFVLEAEALN
jgi:hypothetical protein